MEALWIVGAGGHAKVVIDTARAMGVYEPVGILDDDPKRLGSVVLGVPVCGPATLESAERLGIARMVVGIGNNHLRAELVARFADQIPWATLIHPSAIVSSSVHLADGAVVFAGAVVQPVAAIGCHAIVNTAASVDHDSTLDEFSQICPGVHLAGNVHIRRGAFLGTGALVLPGRSVGAWAIVGAGAVVVSDVPDSATVKGVPARCVPAEYQS